jgi:murein L,D-transpeptidase YcbB/YkuD
MRVLSTRRLVAAAVAGAAMLVLPIVAAAPASAETFAEFQGNCLRHGQELSTDGQFYIPKVQLEQGDTGDCVAYLQELLDTRGWGFNNGRPYGLATDGQFGQLTHNAVVSFQSGMNLSVDGLVGPHTWTALGAFRD